MLDIRPTYQPGSLSDLLWY